MMRKKCNYCGEKTNSKNSFCPHCGNSLNKKHNPENWGMLGKEDFEERNSSQDDILGGFAGNIFNKMLGSAMKMLEKEMKKEISRKDMPSKSNVRLMINGKEIDLNNNSRKNQPDEKERKATKMRFHGFSQENLRKFSELQKKEPSTNIRRFSDKLVYEISMPGVKSLKETSIVKLENSIEIKAIAKEKAYSKIIPVGLPILDYSIEKGKLILEFRTNN